jgi:hypothetical protein
MPVYLCQPGAGQPEPYRHGIQVYAAPCRIDSKDGTAGGGRDLVVANWMPDNTANDVNNNDLAAVAAAAAATTTATSLTGAQQSIRRVRHAEVVLVDDVCIAHDRYWLRLRWPGHKAGFAGYIAMGMVSEGPKGKNRVTLRVYVFVCVCICPCLCLFGM